MIRQNQCLLLAVMIIGLAACGSDDKDSAVGSSSAQDITDVIFTKNAGSCSEYVGTYESNVTDVKRGIGFMGDLKISLSGDTCTITSNDIPNHDFNDASANFATNAAEVSKSYSIPSAATMATSATELSLGTTNAIFLNGVVLDILPAACYGVGNETLGEEKIGCGQNQIDNPWRYDPMSSLNNFGTDSHNAHVQPDGTYHYHGNPVAMFTQNCGTQTDSSPVIGFAADGFPVFGMCISDGGSIRKVTSSYALKAGVRTSVSPYATPVAGQGVVQSNNYDGQFRGDWMYSANLGDLDACNGMTVNGQYGYYITDAYPWAVNCYKGTVQSSFSAKTSLEIMNKLHGHSHN
ncbi:YHYH protein [Pseudomonas sp. HK3]